MLSKFNLVVLTLSLGLGVTSCSRSGMASPLATTPSRSAVVGYEMLTPTAADALLRNPPIELVVLDVRTPSEFAAGHIAGAVDIDLSAVTFTGEVAKLDPKTPYFVYCHSGNRSAASSRLPATTRLQLHLRAARGHRRVAGGRSARYVRHGLRSSSRPSQVRALVL